MVKFPKEKKLEIECIYTSQYVIILAILPI